MSKQNLSKETIRKVKEFFEKYPYKDYCLVDSVKGKVMCCWRDNILWLEELLQV